MRNLLSKISKHKCKRYIFALYVGLMSCGKGGTNTAESLQYGLERPATSTINNALILETNGEFKPSFSLTGTGFVAAIPFDTVTPFASRTELTQETFGHTSITLTLYQENGVPYLTDTLEWQSSGDVPPLPQAYFSELASADAYVYLVLPAFALRGQNTTEVWVEGDLASSVAGGSYYPIPSDDQVLLELSPGDGLKKVRVKYRNVFGAHSESIEISIVRKSKGPVDCKAIPVARKTATGSIRTLISATNEGKLYYRLSGDVQFGKNFIPFDNKVEETIHFLGEEGRKFVLVKIKDEAGNACPDIRLVIDYDTSYIAGTLAIEGEPIWIDNPAIHIITSFDQLPGDLIEMYISGGVIADSVTNQWIPFQARVPVTLSPNDGTRHVIVKYRKNGTVTTEFTTNVFLKPYVIISGGAPNQRLIPSDIIGTSSISITGCAESYDHVPYASDYACTKVGATASVTYYFADGTSVTRSANL